VLLLGCCRRTVSVMIARGERVVVARVLNNGMFLKCDVSTFSHYLKGEVVLYLHYISL
jgi:hypothetical protein